MPAPGQNIITSPTGTEYASVDTGGALNAALTTQNISNLWSKAGDVNATSVAVTSGQTVTLSGSRSFTALSQTQTTAALTVNMPATPSLGQQGIFSITNDVTVLTVSGNGNTIKNAPSTASTASAGGVFGWWFDGTSTWYRRA